MYEDLTKYLPELKKRNHGRWHDQREGEPITMPFVVYEKPDHDLLIAIQDYVKKHREASSYFSTLEKAGIRLELCSMEKADEKKLEGETVIALLVAAVEADKFCEGTYLYFLNTGCVQKWLKRLKKLDDIEEESRDIWD